MLRRMPVREVWLNPTDIIAIHEGEVEGVWDPQGGGPNRGRWMKVPCVVVTCRNGTTLKYKLGETTLGEWAEALKGPLGGPYR